MYYAKRTRARRFYLKNVQWKAERHRTHACVARIIIKVAGITRPSRWHTELHEAEQNSRALNASLDVHRTSTPTKHRPLSTDRATDSATAAACCRCGGRNPANDWRFPPLDYARLTSVCPVPLGFPLDSFFKYPILPPLKLSIFGLSTGGVA